MKTGARSERGRGRSSITSAGRLPALDLAARRPGDRLPVARSGTRCGRFRRGETRHRTPSRRRTWPAGRRTCGRTCLRANPVALAVPCHRVVPAAGGVGGYRWGSARKQALLEREAPPGPARLAVPIEPRDMRPGLRPLALDRPRSRSPAFPAYPKHRGTLDVDVAIVGGGLTGCATAYACAAAGISVALFEADRLGRARPPRRQGGSPTTPGPASSR